MGQIKNWKYSIFFQDSFCHSLSYCCVLSFLVLISYLIHSKLWWNIWTLCSGNTSIHKILASTLYNGRKWQHIILYLMWMMEWASPRMWPYNTTFYFQSWDPISTVQTSEEGIVNYPIFKAYYWSNLEKNTCKQIHTHRCMHIFTCTHTHTCVHTQCLQEYDINVIDGSSVGKGWRNNSLLGNTIGWQDRIRG